MRDGVRGCVQERVLRRMMRSADSTFVTLPQTVIPWIEAQDAANVCFLPVGSNVPVSAPPTMNEPVGFTVAVFGVTESRNLGEVRMMARIFDAVKRKVPGLRILLVGRGAVDANPLLQRELDEQVDVLAEPVLDSASLGRVLGTADALLLVRGVISTRRGTAIAAIAQGLPVVGFQGEETAWPITEAGVVLAPTGDAQSLANSLVRLASDRAWRQRMSSRSRDAFDRFFAWEKIAVTMQNELEMSNR